MTDKQRTQCQLALNWNWRILPDCFYLLSQNVQTYEYVFHDIDGRHPGQTSKTLWYLSNEIHANIQLLVSGGKDSSKKCSWILDGEKVPTWECLFVHRKQGLFLSVYVDDINMPGKKQNMAPMWKKIDQKR